MNEQDTATATDRAGEFQAEIEAMRTKTSRSSTEQVLQIIGVILMIAGPVLALVSYFSSTNQDEFLRQYELIIMAIFGGSLTIIGAALFLRYSIGRFLRFWLLRQIYENRGKSGKSDKTEAETG